MTESDERRKYEIAWASESYRRFSPGLWALERLGVLEEFQRRGVRSMLDAGCGSGKAMRYVIENSDIEVHGFDIAHNALDPFFDGREDILTVGNLWNRDDLTEAYDAVYCTDVMEHIPTDKVADVLANLRGVTRMVGFYGIALFKDSFGNVLIGEPLHLTVKEPTWWQAQLEAAGYRVGKRSIARNEKGAPLWLLVYVDPAHDG